MKISLFFNSFVLGRAHFIWSVILSKFIGCMALAMLQKPISGRDRFIEVSVSIVLRFNPLCIPELLRFLESCLDRIIYIHV